MGSVRGDAQQVIAAVCPEQCLVCSTVTCNSSVRDIKLFQQCQPSSHLAFDSIQYDMYHPVHTRNGN